MSRGMSELTRLASMEMGLLQHEHPAEYKSLLAGVEAYRRGEINDLSMLSHTCCIVRRYPHIMEFLSRNNPSTSAQLVLCDDGKVDLDENGNEVNLAPPYPDFNLDENYNEMEFNNVPNYLRPSSMASVSDVFDDPVLDDLIAQTANKMSLKSRQSLNGALRQTRAGPSMNIMDYAPPPRSSLGSDEELTYNHDCVGGAYSVDSPDAAPTNHFNDSTKGDVNPTPTDHPTDIPTNQHVSFQAAPGTMYNDYSPFPDNHGALHHSAIHEASQGNSLAQPYTADPLQTTMLPTFRSSTRRSARERDIGH